MNNQEIFNTVVQHLRKQGCKAAYNEVSCRYRMGDGRKCAVGILIPDEQYSTLCENKPVAWIIHHVPALRGMDAHLLSMLQTTHDAYEVEEWEERFKKVAEKFHLEVPPHVLA